MDVVTDPRGIEPDHEVTIRPCPVPARARGDGCLLGESTAAVRIEEPGRAPLLGFPAADVRLDLLRRHGDRRRCPAKGAVDPWTIGDGAADDPVAWTLAEPIGILAGREDLVVFDHDRIRVELVEPWGADGETVTRFPDWGDAADLVDLLDVAPLDDHRFVSAAHPDWRRPVVEGSQMLGQAIVAAGRRHPTRRVVSAHTVFTRPADARKPLDLTLAELAHGRTFTTLGVDVTQDGTRRAAGTLLAGEPAPDVVRHAEPTPDVAGPADSEPYDMSVTGRELRIVDGAYTADPDAPVGPPVLDAWVRFRTVPDDPPLHAGLLAQFTGHLSIAAALRPHPGVGQAAAHDSLSTAINAIAISFHAPIRADEWMLYRHRSTYAGDGMTHSECRVHTESGALVASFTVDAMVRHFAGTTAADHGALAL